MNEPDATYRDMHDIWDDYNHRQEFEHTLIDRKTTWLLASQAILFAAYGVTFTKSAADEFRNAVAYLGMSIAGLVFVGVVCLVISKYKSWREYERFFATWGTPKLHGAVARQETPKLPSLLGGRQLKWGASRTNTFLTLVPDLGLPIAFIIAWCVLRF